MIKVFSKNPHIYEGLKGILCNETNVIIRMLAERIREKSEKLIEPMRSEDKESREKTCGMFSLHL